MSKTITVQGVTVEVAQPYEAGHQISEAEAKALNQVRAENIANNCRKQIKELVDEKGVEAASAEAQALIAEKDKDYVFTMASVGGGRQTLDPLTKEARAVAKAFITSKLKEQGISQKDYLEQNGENAIKDKIIEFADHPDVVKLAKKNIAEREKMAGLGTDLAI